VELTVRAYPEEASELRRIDLYFFLPISLNSQVSTSSKSGSKEKGTDFESDNEIDELRDWIKARRGGERGRRKREERDR